MAHKPSLRRQRGNEAEQAAQQWLCRQGLTPVSRNWHCRQGELDLVMHNQDTLVFIEVRLRNHHRFGGAEASVTADKQARLVQAASLYLASYPDWAQWPCRFDVLAMHRHNGHYAFNWIQNAFYGD